MAILCDRSKKKAALLLKSSGPFVNPLPSFFPFHITNIETIQYYATHNTIYFKVVGSVVVACIL